MPVRKERNRILRELAAAKNHEFRGRMVGKVLSAVTLNEARTALTENYLKVELAHYSEPNTIVDVRIGGVTPAGLRELTSPAALPWLSIL
jgi:tRNA A37 methylthiotransferase MiaB